MKNNIIQKIIRGKTPCFFVSPHLDDAILSAGDLISYLSDKVPVKCINVFTKTGGCHTHSAKMFLKYANYNNSYTFYHERMAEDSRVFAKIGVKKVDLGFIDALWRTKSDKGVLSKLGKYIPELNALYPTYKFHIAKGYIANKDIDLVYSLSAKLKQLTSKKAVVFCPLGIGNHTDHKIAKAACEKAFESLIYWADFPYSRRVSTDIFQKLTGRYKRFDFINDLNKKEILIKMYKTQFKSLFPPDKKMVLEAENFFYQ